MGRANRGRGLTSREAARALGVSEASVKRWADGGLLPMEKTAGGHRRFRPEDVALVRRAGLGGAGARTPAGMFAAGAVPARTAAVELAPEEAAALAGETFGALLDGRDGELSALLAGLHLRGLSVGRIADDILCAAMRRVGHLWHAGRLSVAQEHVATRTATSTLESLRAASAPHRGGGPRALCCSVEEDFHELPVRLAALTLEACGAEVFNLGMSTPFSALEESVERFRPGLVCVSSTVLVSLDRAAREYEGFYRAARRAGTRVVLGGAGFADAGVRARLPADLHAESFRQLEEFAAASGAGDEGS